MARMRTMKNVENYVKECSDWINRLKERDYYTDLERAIVLSDYVCNIVYALPRSKKRVFTTVLCSYKRGMTKAELGHRLASTDRAVQSHLTTLCKLGLLTKRDDGCYVIDTMLLKASIINSTSSDSWRAFRKENSQLDDNVVLDHFLDIETARVIESFEKLI